MLQNSAGHSKSQAAQRRNRSVSESGGGEEESLPNNRVRSLSGGPSTVTLSSSNSEITNAPKGMNLSHCRNRTGSFGSGKLGHSKRRNDSGSSNSQSKNRHTLKSQESNCRSQMIGRERFPNNSKNEQSKNITTNADNISK